MNEGVGRGRRQLEHRAGVPPPHANWGPLDSDSGIGIIGMPCARDARERAGYDVPRVAAVQDRRV